MYELDFVVVVLPEASLDGLLEAALLAALDEVDEVPPDGEAPTDWFDTSYSMLRQDGSSAHVVRASLDVSEDKVDRLIEALVENLRTAADLGAVHVVKFLDTRRLELYRTYYAELCQIEMRLRTVFTLMFVDAAADPYDLLSAGTVGKLPDAPGPEELSRRAENEFFFISFSAYVALAARRRPKDLAEAVLSASDFEDLQRLYSPTLDLAPDYLDFIAKIKPSMDSIEKFRNAVAHNRDISATLHSNYVKARDALNNALDEFFATEPVAVLPPPAEVAEALAPAAAAGPLVEPAAAGPVFKAVAEETAAGPVVEPAAAETAAGPVVEPAAAETALPEEEVGESPPPEPT